MKKVQKMKTQTDTKRNTKIITIPNILSVVRLCMIPWIVWLYCVKEEYILTTVVLTLSGLTDIVDGFIARRFNMISDIGKALDPIADKLTQIAMMLCLVSRFPYVLIPLVLLIAKEIFAAVMGILVIKSTGSVQGAVWHGKLTTVCIYALMVLHLLWSNIPSTVSLISVGVCSGFMIMSCILYSINNVGLLKNAKNKKQ